MLIDENFFLCLYFSFDLLFFFFIYLFVYFILYLGEKVYEDVERLLKRASTMRGKGQQEAFERNAPARRSVIMDVFGKSGGSLHRALWCEMPEVKRDWFSQCLSVSLC